MNLAFFDKHSQDYAKLLAQFESNDKSKLGVIYIEDISDKPFWQKIAAKHEIKLYSENGKSITGKSKLLQICSPNQLIAIDSDFDNLCPNTNSNDWINRKNKEFVLQTYAHGRENLIFSPDCLHAVLESKFKLYSDIHTNPILAIFQKLSDIWFTPYQKFLYLYNQERHSHDDWIKAIFFQNQECQDIAIRQEFNAYQDRLLALDSQLNANIDNQNDFDEFCTHLTEQDFLKDTVWAFIRCHDFEKQFVEPLMKEIIKDRQNKEFGDVQDTYSDNEIGNRRKELSNYFKDIHHLKTILHHYFYDVYFQTAKHSHLFLNKIIQDYNKIINA